MSLYGHESDLPRRLLAGREESPASAFAPEAVAITGVAHSRGDGLGFLGRQVSGGSAARFRRSLHLLQTTTIHIVDIAVDRDVLRYERMLGNTAYVLKHARRLICDCMPFDEMASNMAAAVMRIRPLFAVERGGTEIILKQIGHNAVRKELHSAIRVMNDKPLERP